MKNRLRVLRAEKNWTQAELAGMVGISRQAVIAVMAVHIPIQTGRRSL